MRLILLHANGSYRLRFRNVRSVYPARRNPPACSPSAVGQQNAGHNSSTGPACFVFADPSLLCGAVVDFGELPRPADAELMDNRQDFTAPGFFPTCGHSVPPVVYLAPDPHVPFLTHVVFSLSSSPLVLSAARFPLVLVSPTDQGVINALAILAPYP